MIGRIKKGLSPGVVLGTIALVVAIGGSSIAMVQAQDGKKSALKGRFGGGSLEVVRNYTMLPQTVNNGISDEIITCPSAGKAGPRRAVSGGVRDIRPPDNTRNLAPLDQAVNSPQGDGWLFQFDNDTNIALVVELRVLCTLNKLNVKR